MSFLFQLDQRWKDVKSVSISDDALPPPLYSLESCGYFWGGGGRLNGDLEKFDWMRWREERVSLSHGYHYRFKFEGEYF